MKKGLLWMSVCALFTVSCATEPAEKPSTETSELVSFGFYAEDNEALEADYVIETIEDEMVVRVPKGTDKTALVARFELSENGVLIIDEVEQVSGQTANDFSYTIDFEVKNTESELLTSYSVRVGDILDMVWTPFASFIDTYEGTQLEGDNFAMAVSPVDNLPYVFLSRERPLTPEDSWPDSYGVVVSFDEKGVGTATPELTYSKDGEILIEPDNSDIAIDAEGKVYIAYNADYEDAEEVDHEYELVKTGSGSSWSVVGDQFGTSAPGSYYGLEIDPASKNIIYGWMANAATDVLAKREWEVCSYNGTSWTDGVTISDLATKTIYWGNYKAINGTLYFCGMIVDESCFVYKYNAGTWEKVINALPAGVSIPATSVGISFDVAKDGTVYIFTAGDEDEGVWHLKVYKCAPGASEWTKVASNIAPASSSVRVSMALYNDLPIVLYRDSETSFPMITSLNPESLDWNTPTALKEVECGKYGGIHIEFAPNGVGYAAFMDDTDDALAPLTVYKFALEDEVIK